MKVLDQERAGTMGKSIVSRLKTISRAAVDALEEALIYGNAARAVRLAQDHLAVARRNTLAFGSDQTIEAKLMSDLGPRLVPRATYNGRPPQSRKGSGT